MLTITNADDKKYLYFCSLQHVYSHLSAGRAQSTPNSSPAVTVGDSRGLLVAGAVHTEVLGPQTIASKIKYKTAATMMAATMA